MTNRKTVPTESGARKFNPTEQAEAHGRAKMLVGKWCATRAREWREDVAADAFARWLKESAGAPVDQYVRWAIADASQREKQEKTATDRVDDLKRATFAQDPFAPQRRSGVRPRELERARVERFTQDEQPELKAAVRRLCAAAYEETWGHPWTSQHEAARELLEGLSADHAEAERQGRAAAAGLIEALARCTSCIDQAQPTIEGKPTVGGYAVKSLFDARREIRSLVARLSTDLGAGGYLESRLHRFVGAAISHAGFRRALGCTRPLDAAELTVVWILSGGWPEIRSWRAGGLSAMHVVHRVMKPAVAQALDAYLRAK